MQNKKRVVVGFPDSRNLAKQLAKRSKSRYAEVEVREFPDKETYLRFRDNLEGTSVFLVRSLNDPNKKIVEILFAAYTARELGAKKVVLISPYLCYMRQDKRFKPGEAISNRIIAKLFNRCFDSLITVDPHLHRRKGLDSIFSIKTKRLTAVQPIADFIKKNIKKPFIFGPDIESYQWARRVAKILGCKAEILKKQRYSSRKVRVRLGKGYNLKKRSVVIVDDIISTGHTVMEVIKGVKALGARKIYCICTHGIFAENALKKIRGLGAVVYSTNSVQNKTSRINLADLMSKKIK